MYLYKTASFLYQPSLFKVFLRGSSLTQVSLYVSFPHLFHAILWEICIYKIGSSLIAICPGVLTICCVYLTWSFSPGQFMPWPIVCLLSVCPPLVFHIFDICFRIVSQAETWWEEALWLHRDSELLKQFHSDIQDDCRVLQTTSQKPSVGLSHGGHIENLQTTFAHD